MLETFFPANLLIIADAEEAKHKKNTKIA